MINYSDSAMSLLPPLIAIFLAIVSRHVLLSLAIGIILAALLLFNFNIVHSTEYVQSQFGSIIWKDTGFNLDKLYILGFILLLGMITALITISGATAAFATWAKERIRCKRDAKLLTMLLGIVIFIDDYFNSIVVGAVARPITDRFYVSRAKLAYILDSTAAPICVISPISSWGAYIIALIGGLLTTHGLVQIGQFNAFVQMIPMNFYALFALALLFMVVYWGLDIGPMLKQEQAAKKGMLFDELKGTPPGEATELPQSDNGSKLGLFLPIFLLVIATIALMIHSGANALSAQSRAFSVLGAFENTNVAFSLFYGASIGFIATALFFLIQSQNVKHIFIAVISGIRSMLAAVWILIFAWTIASAISDMQTGKYMASLAAQAVPIAMLPAILFLLAGVAAFATGTSWGTFGVMLPIAADMAAAADISLMLPMLSAVLAGAVFGDHCSPISDTTILSSTGAHCHHIDHVLTQLPYALMTATISVAGYLVLGYTGSVLMALAMCCIVFLVIIAKLKQNVVC